MDKNDLISRSALVSYLEENCPLNWTDSEAEIQAVNDYDDFIKAVKNSHTIDAVPVVRCKDCVHQDDRSIRWCNKLNRVVRAIDFCSRGERKESNES